MGQAQLEAPVPRYGLHSTIASHPRKRTQRERIQTLAFSAVPSYYAPSSSCWTLFSPNPNPGPSLRIHVCTVDGSPFFPPLPPLRHASREKRITLAQGRSPNIWILFSLSLGLSSGFPFSRPVTPPLTRFIPSTTLEVTIITSNTSFRQPYLFFNTLDEEL